MTNYLVLDNFRSQLEAEAIALYEAVRSQQSEAAGSFVILDNDGQVTQKGGTFPLWFNETTGLTYISIKRRNDDQHAQEFVLLAKVGEVSPDNKIALSAPSSKGYVAAPCAMESDLLSFNHEPGLYYTSVISHRDRRAVLTGPFISHAQAMRGLRVARAYAQTLPGTEFASYGTLTLKPEWYAKSGEPIPLGKINDPVLTEEERRAAQEVVDAFTVYETENTEAAEPTPA
jgi:hypothetical protein